MFIDRKDIFKFKAGNKIVSLPTQFCLGSMSNKFDANEYREISLKDSVYNFLVDYNGSDKSDILNIHKYLMVKNNIKLHSALFKKCLLYF